MAEEPSASCHTRRRSPPWRGAPLPSREAKRRTACGCLEHPPLYTAGTSAAPERAASARPVPRVQERARRALHLSRPRPARGLCDVRPRPARPRRPGLRHISRRLADRDAGAPRRRGRAAARFRSASSFEEPRSPASACACAAGSRCTARASTSRRSLSISPASCHADWSTRQMTSLAALGAETDMDEVDDALRAALRGGVWEDAAQRQRSVAITLKPEGDRAAFVDDGHGGDLRAAGSNGAALEHLFDRCRRA